MEETLIKDIRPGTIVELPKEYLGKKYAMYMGSELRPGNEVLPTLQIIDKGNFVHFPIGRVPGTDKLKEAPQEQAAEILGAVKGFAKIEKLSIPYLGVTSGCDPEIFVLDELEQVIPAWCFLPTEEKATEKASLNGTQTYAFWDGFQAEFAPRASHCLEEVGDQIRYGLRRVLESAQTLDKKAHLTLKSAVKLSDKVLQEATDEQIRFRCSPSYNVYRDVSAPPADPRAYPYRFAGGHIHIGRKAKLPAPVIGEVVRGLDSILGVAGVSLSAGIDSSERRTMYGRAGEFRLPEHGIEYRVLSNFWLSHPAIYHLVFEMARQVVRLATSGLYRTCWEANEIETRNVINDNDIEGARKILQRNKHVLFCMFKDVWSKGNVTDLAVRTVLNGIEVAIKDPLNIEGNWDLVEGKTWKTNGKHKGGCWASQVHHELSGARSATV